MSDLSDKIAAIIRGNVHAAGSPAQNMAGVDVAAEAVEKLCASYMTELLELRQLVDAQRLAAQEMLTFLEDSKNESTDDVERAKISIEISVVRSLLRTLGLEVSK